MEMNGGALNGGGAAFGEGMAHDYSSELGQQQHYGGEAGMVQPILLGDSMPNDMGGFQYDGGSGMPQDGLGTMPSPPKRRPTDPYNEEESAGVLEDFRQAFELKVVERAQREAEEGREALRRAEEELDGFYDKRTDQV
ncbi:unnamed protein product [Discosporangium mesarthrocarpum]